MRFTSRLVFLTLKNSAWTIAKFPMKDAKKFAAKKTLLENQLNSLYFLFYLFVEFVSCKFVKFFQSMKHR